MHYVPHSTSEFLPGEDHDHHGHHTHDHHEIGSLPLYCLAGLIGTFLVLDIVLGWEPLRNLTGSWVNDLRSPFGIRLALLAAILGGSRILYHTLEGLFAGKIGADLALTIATLAAIILKEYFVSAMVVFIASCGECLEAFTVGRAKQAVRKILELTPKIVHVRRDGKETDIPLDELQINETVLVRPGERMPADGHVDHGTSTVDQSALTGESLPLEKQVGDEVYAGTLNQFGALEIHVEKLGSETILGQVIHLVAEASQRKAPLERTADRYAKYFLPAVLALAIITHIVNNWGQDSISWMPTLAVLVVACPCPLILATPAAVMAAMAWLARRGIVIKGSVALEQLAQIDTVAFDKTGTLTEGRLSLGTLLPLESISELDLLRIAATAEQNSEHPLARVLMEQANEKGMVLPPVSQFTALPGSGVIVQCQKSLIGNAFQSLETQDSPHLDIMVGNRRLMEQHKLPLNEAVLTRLDRLDHNGETSLIVAVNQQVIGIIGARDTIRPEAAGVLHELHHLGITETVLLTGDRKSAAESVSSKIGFLAEVNAEMLPGDKARWIEQARHNKKNVAMIGDGVNDAPALAAADVGLALGGIGSDIAAEAGDVVLMGDPLTPLPGLIRLARYTMRIIKQNIIVFAFGVNFIGVVLTAWILPGWSEAWEKSSPVAAAIFHEFASLAVMINAMRLLWFERGDTTFLGRMPKQLIRFADLILWVVDPRNLLFFLYTKRQAFFQICKFTLVIVPLSSWFLWNTTIVRPGEQALAIKFGRYSQTLQTGIHWNWPPPFGHIVKQQVGAMRIIELGFRTPQDLVRLTPDDSIEYLIRSSEPLEWDNPHLDGRYERQSEESLVFTGDEMLVECNAVIQYHISDLKKYVFSIQNPEEAIRASSESLLREIIAQMSLDQVLTSGRKEIEIKALEYIQQNLDRYESGIQLRQFRLQDVHPPIEVVADYRDVNSAFERRQSQINEAQADYIRQVFQIAGKQAVERLTQRKGTPSEDSELLDTEWQALLKELSGSAMQRILDAQGKAFRDIGNARGESARFLSRSQSYRLNPPLTRFRLYWETLEKGLVDLEKIIVDPKINGHKQLFMGNRLNLDSIIIQNQESTTNDTELTDPLSLQESALRSVPARDKTGPRQPTRHSR